MGHTVMDPDYGLTSACEAMKVRSRLQSSCCIRGFKTVVMVASRSGGFPVFSGEEQSASDACATGAGCVPV